MSDLVLSIRDVQLECDRCRSLFTLTREEQAACSHFALPWPTLCRRCRTTYPLQLPGEAQSRRDRSPAVWLIVGGLVTLLGVGAVVFMTSRLALSAPAPITESGIRVTTTYLNLRTGPTREARSLGELEPGSELVVLGRSGDWLHVTYHGQDGFAHSAYVTLPPAGRKESKEEHHRAR